MSSATTIDFQIANTANLAKIEAFMNAAAYQENIEYSSSFNTRLRLERRLRLPFFDPQTGVAQNHCSLFMARRQRMPGFRQGQLYTYPANRWRKHRRQYLTKMPRPFGALGSATPATIPQTNGTSNSNSIAHRRIECGPTEVDSDFNVSASSFLEESSSLGGGAGDTSDSKDSQNVKEDLPKDWFYDDMDINEIDSLEEPKSPADDEYDYDPRYGNKKRKKRKPSSRKSMIPHIGDGPRKGRPPGGGVVGGRGRGRRRNPGSRSKHVVEPPSPSIVEPPSFETAAAAVEQANEDSCSGDLRSYRKYM